MATIITKNGSGSAVPPSLTQGELAINVDNGTLYYGSGSSNAVRTITASLALSASYLIGGGAGTPGGANTTIQFNDAGAFSGSGNFTINKSTNTVSLTGSLNITDSIYFSGSGAASRLVWNDTDGTLDLGLKGGNVTLQIGQEQVIRVVNKTGANLLESQYKAVRIRRVDEGGAQGQRLAIVLAQADNDGNSVDTLGLVTENIDDNQEGFITNSGLVRGIDTTGTLQGETWVDGDPLYLSPTTSGSITKVKPQAPQHTITIGYVVYAHAINGKIFVKVDNGYELDELHNVRITTGSLTSGDLLVYSSSVWINTKQLTGSYSLTGSLQATSFTGSLFGTASWATNALTASFALNGGGGGATILKKENITFASSSWVSQSLYVYEYTDTDIAASSSIVDFTPNTASFTTVVNAIVYPTVVVTTGTASFFATNQPANDITGELVITNI